MFKVGDRVFHETKGFARVLWVGEAVTLLELDKEIGSRYVASRETTDHVPRNPVKVGSWYWRASSSMVSLVARNKFKGNK